MAMASVRSFFVVQERRILERFLALLPLVQSLIQKVLDKSFLGQGGMIIQIRFQLLEHILRDLNGQSSLFLFCGGRLVQVGGQDFGEVFTDSHFWGLRLH